MKSAAYVAGLVAGLYHQHAIQSLELDLSVHAANLRAALARGDAEESRKLQDMIERLHKAIAVLSKEEP